jgi:predicted nucleic acid-binding protein
MLYFDTSYIVRLHSRDAGWEAVRKLARTDNIACCIHGHAEAVAAFHRKLRENVITQKEFATVIAEFERDSDAGAFVWLPFSPAVVARAAKAFKVLPASIYLRAADALHLACAVENGFKEIFSNDTRLLDAASNFGLKGTNVIRKDLDPE